MKKTTKIIPVINQKIKEKRKELKIIQEDFTKMINKSIATVKRYDTGDIIPENTLILICDKLNLDKISLIEEQKKQNELQKTTFYNDLIIRNSAILRLKKVLEDNELKNKSFINQLEFIYKSFNYKTKDFIKVEYKDNRFYISNKNNILDILTSKQAINFVEDLQEYFDFKTERLRKEKLNK